MAVASALSGVERLRRWLVLPTIVFSQFAGSSLWFAPNAILMQVPFQLQGNHAALGGDSETTLLTSLVQAGFVFGTLVFSYLAIADRLPPERVFAFASAVGALCNGLCAVTTHLAAWAVLRLAVGFCLAGIYPIGMKVAARQYPQGLGGRLGFVVGALTLGTAFPWLLRVLVGGGPRAGPGGGQGAEASGPAVAVSYVWVLALVSALASAGGLLLMLVVGAGPTPPGPAAAPAGGTAQQRPAAAAAAGEARCGAGVAAGATALAVGAAQLRSPSSTTQIIIQHDYEEPGQTPPGPSTCAAEHSAAPLQQPQPQPQPQPQQPQPQPQQKFLVGLVSLRQIWSARPFRAACLGYLGHCWELYTVWAFIPVLIRAHFDAQLAARAAPAPGPPVPASMSDQHSASGSNSGAWSLELLSFVAIAIGAPASALVGLWSLFADMPLRRPHVRVGHLGWSPTPAHKAGSGAAAAAPEALAAVVADGVGVIPGSAVAAISCLFVSGLCCLLAPLYSRMSPPLFRAYLCLWGASTIADSGQFSSLCARGAPPALVGTALTMTTCLGFTITIVSIQLVGALLGAGVDAGLAMLALAPGPALGLVAAYAEWPLHRAALF